MRCFCVSVRFRYIGCDNEVSTERYRNAERKRLSTVLLVVQRSYNVEIRL